MRKIYLHSLLIVILVLTSFYTKLFAQQAETIYNAASESKFVLNSTLPIPVLFDNNIDTTGVLFFNGPLVTHPDSGVGGADESRFQGSIGLSTYGIGFQNSSNNRVADDFSVQSGWEIDSVVFFAYQTGSTLVPTINYANIRIWEGSPASGGTIVFGDAAVNYLSDTIWSGIYRTLEAGGDVNRPVMKITCDLSDSNLILISGTYWLDMQAGGTLSSGPWIPPVSIWNQTVTGNAIQKTGTWADIYSGSYQQGLPFIIYGKKIILKDIRIKSWLYPLDDVELTNSNPVVVQIENTGDTVINQFVLSYSIDSGLTYVSDDTVKYSLQPGESYIYTFTTKADFSQFKRYQCMIRVEYESDMNLKNNSLSHAFINFKRISTFPYKEDFESEHFWYHGMISGSDSWELGIPDGSHINTVPPSGGTKTWMTDLDTYYPINEVSYVVSPAFDLQNLEEAYISMSINCASYDMTSLQYSIDKGKSWNTVGSVYSQGYNWYNYDNGEDDNWTDNSGDWVTAIHSLKGITGKKDVLFRIRFQSNEFDNWDGFAFDNVRIFSQPEKDLAITEWMYPTKICSVVGDDSIRVKIKNNGTMAQDTFSLVYSVDNGTNEIIENVIHTIPAGGEYVYTFDQTAYISNIGITYCYAYVISKEDEIEWNNKINFNISGADPIKYGIQNFESGLVGNGCSLEYQTGFAWTKESGSTYTDYTGPSGSHKGSNYMYTPAYLGFPGNVTTYYSPCLDFAVNDAGKVSFWSHMYGAESGELHIDALNSTGWVNDIYTLKGEQQSSSDDEWQLNNVVLASDVTQIRIRAVNGSGILSDMAVDDVAIDTMNNHDVGVISIDNPLYNLMPVLEFTPSATVANYGTSPATFDVKIQCGSYVDTMTVSLNVFEERKITFEPFTPAIGSNIIELKTLLEEDLNIINDTLSFNFMVEENLTKAYAFSYETHHPFMFYLEHPETFFLLNTYYNNVITAGAWVEGKWYGVEYFGKCIYEIDTITGEGRKIKDIPVQFLGLAYDPNTMKIYGADHYSNLYYSDIASGDFTLIGNYGNGRNTICISYAGKDSLYVYCSNNDSIYLLNVNDLSLEPIMFSGYGNGSYFQGFDYNHHNGMVYLAATSYGLNGELRWVDFENDTTRVIGNFQNNKQVAALAIPYIAEKRAEIISYSINGQEQTAEIDHVNRTIHVTMPNYIKDFTSLIANFVLTQGADATINAVEQVSGETSNNFAANVTYKITNGVTSQNWIVTVTSIDVNFLRYSLPEQVEPAIINDTTRVIEVVVPPETILDSLVATFVISQGAIAKVADSVQVSEKSSNDFSGWVTYWIVNGKDSIDWTVKVSYDDLHGTDFLTYSFTQQTAPAVINKDKHTIDIICSAETKLNSLIASFTLSNGAIALIGPNLQTSGITVNDFSSSLVYTVFSQMGDLQDWFVTVTRLLYTGADILSFKVEDQLGVEEIDNNKKTVKINVEPGTDLSRIRPSSVEISSGASINPGVTKRQDFSSGPVTYVVTSESGISKSWKVTIGYDVSIETISQNPCISVYPVPASDILYINPFNAEIKQIRIFDLLGNVVYTNRTQTFNSVLVLNIEKLQTGIYIIEVFSSEGLIRKKIQVIR